MCEVYHRQNSQTNAPLRPAGRRAERRGFAILWAGSAEVQLQMTASDIAPNRHAVHPFDEKYGTDTGGYLSPQEIATGRAHDAFNFGYSAIAPSVFREACRRWRDTLPVAAQRLTAYSFVDLGAGKGRALLLAAEM